MNASELPTPPFTWVDNPAVLAALCERLQHAPRVAVDTEADSLHHYYEKVCLIQISAQDEHWLVDPLADMDLAALLAILTTKPLILHYADYDLRMLRRGYGFAPQGEVFDTMTAAALLGHAAPNLSAMVEQFFNVVLPKGSKKSDWSRRPLSPRQLAYAVRDTCYLEALADKLAAELTRRGRLDWHRQACAAGVKAALQDRPEPDAERCWRIRGLRGLNARELALVRALWHWREAEAQAADLPPFKVMGNSLIIRLAKWAHRDGQLDLDNGQAPHLPRTCNGKRRGRLRQALTAAVRLHPKDFPGKPQWQRPLGPGADFEALRQACAAKAQALGLEPSLVAPRALLTHLSRQMPASAHDILADHPSVQPWQAEILAEIIAEIRNHAATASG